MWWWSSASPLVSGSVGAGPGAVQGREARAAWVAADWAESHALASRGEHELPALRRIGAAGWRLLGAVDDLRPQHRVAVGKVARIEDLVRTDRPAGLCDEERSTSPAPAACESGGRLGRREYACLELVDRHRVRRDDGAHGEGVQARLEDGGDEPVAAVAEVPGRAVRGPGVEAVDEVVHLGHRPLRGVDLRVRDPVAPHRQNALAVKRRCDGEAGVADAGERRGDADDGGQETDHGNAAAHAANLLSSLVMARPG